MNWRYKAVLQGVFSNLPGGERLNYLCQRWITKSLPTRDDKFSAIVSHAEEHVRMFRKHGTRELGHATFYEFGAGWDLMIPFAFYAFGAGRQKLVDLRNLLRVELVNDTIDKFNSVPLSMKLMRSPNQPLPRDRRFLALLESIYGIQFHAPCDARATGFPADSIYFISSTNTLEHIAPVDIRAILLECHKLLRNDGVMSFRVDYQDHYAYFDSGISVYNFLRYSSKQWRFYKPRLHYQNRLRHKDYLRMVKETGFSVLEERRYDGNEKDYETLERLPLDPQFRHYSFLELAVRHALLVLRKGPP